MKIIFCGGAKSVTGANHLVEFGRTKFLVDCGMFQGYQELENLNYRNFIYDPKKIKYLFLTHSHLDHTGRIPYLYKKGFRGKVICTAPTKDIAHVALLDAAKIAKERAEDLGYPPLYTRKEVEAVIKLFEPHPYHDVLKLSSNFSVRLLNAGHILGSTIFEFFIKEKGKEKKIVFTGDLGNPPTPLLNPIDPVGKADYVVIESAYGDRLHEDRKERKNILKKTIEEVIKTKGVLLMPSFAIERTQEILYELNNLVENKKIGPVKIFIDSPLAIKITRVYQKYDSFFNTTALNLIKSGDDLFDFPGLKMTVTRQESKNILKTRPPKIIIAGSGMSTGGRIQYHEKDYLSNPKTTILFIGYQVEGTLGRKIFEGQSPLKIKGKEVKINAQIKAIGGYSAHADQNGLINFVDDIPGKVKKVFIVQGEEKAATVLKAKIENKLKINAEVPGIDQVYKI